MLHAMQHLALVTGGAGFVGSHLCERLVAEGYRVISLDDYSLGSTDNHVAGVEYREGHTKDIEKLVPERPDVIFHLGEYSRVHTSSEEPELVFDKNIIGTLAVLSFWRKTGAKLVYAASSTKRDATTTAKGVPGRDLTPYTFSKAMNVDLINNYARWYKLPYAITYFYNVYGPRERGWGAYGTVVETFRQNRLSGTPHKVNAPGTQTRAFTHVLDTVDALIRVAKEGEGDGYAICSGEVVSIMELAQLFGGEIQETPQTAMSRSAGAEDVSKLAALGWKPKHTLREYIQSL